MSGLWDHVPPGCSVESGGDWAAHFNKRTTSRNAHGSYTLILFSAVAEADCLEAAKTIYGSVVTAKRSTLQVGTWTHVPPGCSVESGGDWAAHFNKGLIGNSSANNNSYTLVYSNHDLVNGISASMSSQYGGFSASRCLTRSSNNDGMCHSNKSSGRWLEVKFDKFYEFKHAVVDNRDSCCQNRFNSYTLTVDNNICNKGNVKGFYKTSVLPCVETGHRIRLTLNDNEYLNLQYLGGIGTPAVIVHGIKAAINSTPYNTSYGANKCLRDDDKMCVTSSSSKSVPKWLEVTFDGFYAITLGVVGNRKDCCQSRFRSYELRLGGHACAKGDANGYNGHVAIPCVGTGDSLRLIQLDSDYLNLNFLYGIGDRVSVVNGRSAKLSTTYGGHTEAQNCLSPGGKFCHSGDARRRSLQKQKRSLLDYQIITEKTCLTAALAQFGSKVTSRRGLQAGSWGHVPPGCSVQSKGDWAAHYNRDRKGKDKDKAYTLVDQKRPDVISQVRCQTEAELQFGGKVTHKRKMQVGSWGHVPPGCSVQSKGDWAAHYNTNPNGKNDGSYTHIGSRPDFYREVRGKYARLAPPYGGFYATNCLNPGGHDGGMCHSGRGSGNGNKSWLEVTFADVYKFWGVIVENRQSCCQNRFRKYVVTISNTPCNSGDANSVSGRITVQCMLDFPRTGSTILLTLLTDSYLNLQFLGGFGDKVTTVDAKSARQSRTHGSFAASNCLKNNDSMCHTEGGGTHWLEMTFDQTYNFSYGVVHNRKDCCQDRFKTFTLAVDWVKCGSGDAEGRSGLTTAACSAIGRRMRLTKPNPVINLLYFGAVGYPATVESEWTSGTWAVGHYNKWLQVKFDRTYSLTHALVENRKDCCQDRFRYYALSISGSLCSRGDAGSPHGTIAIPCIGVGDSLKITVYDMDFLNLQYLGGIEAKAWTYTGGSCNHDGNKYQCSTCKVDCPIGQYRLWCSGTSAGVCAACTNGKPSNAAYTGQGSVNGDNCAWTCNPKRCADGEVYNIGTCECEGRKSCPDTHVERCGTSRLLHLPCSEILPLDQNVRAHCRCERKSTMCVIGYKKTGCRRRRDLLGGGRRRSPPPRPPTAPNTGSVACTGNGTYKLPTAGGGCKCEYEHSCPKGKIFVSCVEVDTSNIDEDRRRSLQRVKYTYTEKETLPNGQCCAKRLEVNSF